MTVINLQTMFNLDLTSMTDYTERFSSSVATGDQTITLTLTKGSSRSIIEVYAFIPGAGDAAYFEVHRTDGSASSANITGESNYNANTSVIFDSIETPVTVALKIKLNTDNADTVTCYFTVKYYYK